MTLITCYECKTEVSTVAKSCPKCGANAKAMKGPKQKISTPPMSMRTKLMIGAGFFVFLIIGSIESALHPQPAQPQVADANSSKTPQQAEEDKQTSLRDRSVMNVVVALKSMMRDPDSLSIKHISANDDGGVICISYRAQNGFGGTNYEHSVFLNEDLASGASAWNKNCVHKELYDETEIAQVAHMLGQM